MQGKANETSETTADKFKVTNGIVPKNGSSWYFDFECKGSDGSPISSAARCKNAILSSDGASADAVASGGGR